jgi:hypothetical protein
MSFQSYRPSPSPPARLIRRDEYPPVGSQAFRDLAQSFATPASAHGMIAQQPAQFGPVDINSHIPRRLAPAPMDVNRHIPSRSAHSSAGFAAAARSMSVPVQPIPSASHLRFGRVIEPEQRLQPSVREDNELIEVDGQFKTRREMVDSLREKLQKERQEAALAALVQESDSESEVEEEPVEQEYEIDNCGNRRPIFHRPIMVEPEISDEESEYESDSEIDEADLDELYAEQEALEDIYSAGGYETADEEEAKENAMMAASAASMSAREEEEWERQGLRRYQTPRDFEETFRAKQRDRQELSSFIRSGLREGLRQFLPTNKFLSSKL